MLDNVNPQAANQNQPLSKVIHPLIGLVKIELLIILFAKTTFFFFESQKKLEQAGEITFNKNKTKKKTPLNIKRKDDGEERNNIRKNLFIILI